MLKVEGSSRSQIRIDDANVYNALLDMDRDARTDCDLAGFRYLTKFSRLHKHRQRYRTVNAEPLVP